MVKRFEATNGTIIYVNEYGVYHRADGPAVIYTTGKECWFLNGKEYSFNVWLQVINISDEEKMKLILRYG